MVTMLNSMPRYCAQVRMIIDYSIETVGAATRHLSHMFLADQLRQTLKDELMHETLLYSGPFLWRPSHHPLHKSQHARRRTLQPLLQRSSRTPPLKIRKIKLLSPLAFLKEVSGRRAQSGKQHLHLFLFSSRGEKGRASVNFKDEAAETPNIYLVVIRLHQNYFW